jgi:hypothetical protein
MGIAGAYLSLAQFNAYRSTLSSSRWQSWRACVQAMQSVRSGSDKMERVSLEIRE